MQGSNDMASVERIEELLNILELFYDEVESSLDDEEKEVYLPKIGAHRAFIEERAKLLKTIGPKMGKGSEELVKIHSDILNKYFS
jgi:hypothetical protein